MSAKDYAAKRLHEFANPASAVVVDAEDVIDAIMKAIKEELTPKDQTFQEFFGLDEKPQLIQGYTAEQWQEIIDGGYLCEFRHIGSEPWRIMKLGGIFCQETEDYIFKDISAESWAYCRPAQIKGVMRPIFVEPVDKGEMICMFTAGGFPLNNIRSRISYDAYRLRENTDYSDATKYIEL